MKTIETACPVCGSDGPHTVLGREGGNLIIECNGDYCGEFEVPEDAL